jgi:uncharacterized coiled-coil DUF342 family protein
MDELKVKYTELCNKVGDLYFVVEALKSQLDQANKQMDEYKTLREQLHAAFVAASKEVPGVVENTSDVQGG